MDSIKHMIDQIKRKLSEGRRSNTYDIQNVDSASEASEFCTPESYIAYDGDVSKLNFYACDNTDSSSYLSYSSAQLDGSMISDAELPNMSISIQQSIVLNDTTNDNDNSRIIDRTISNQTSQHTTDLVEDKFSMWLPLEDDPQWNGSPMQLLRKEVVNTSKNVKFQSPTIQSSPCISAVSELVTQQKVGAPSLSHRRQIITDNRSRGQKIDDEMELARIMAAYRRNNSDGINYMEEKISELKRRNGCNNTKKEGITWENEDGKSWYWASLEECSESKGIPAANKRVAALKNESNVQKISPISMSDIDFSLIPSPVYPTQSPLIMSSSAISKESWEVIPSDLAVSHKHFHLTFIEEEEEEK